ncbi:glycosyltransferase family 4 protein [Lentzea sp. PSKA42]|uniref:Glycosyltransferase family 4 protein n=1 Tax=Lentzea indica TaxID=2604800 RepID=A0ABX1FCY7_9PSEU|nr:glycosyltransferase family 4 protein [Lentzea indica]NKE56775.1 glycosyltransferase family 4 protein [Lentzea indica]
MTTKEATSARRLRVVLVLKTNRGCLWTTPHVDALLARGHDVVAVLPPGDGRLRHELAGRGVSVVDSPFDFRFRPSVHTLAGLLKLRDVLRALEPDVLHYHLLASALAVRLTGLATRAARVHMVPGPLYLESRLIRLLERITARLDTVTICGSRFTARRYRELGRPPARTPVVPYGVDTRLFRPPSPAERVEARARASAGAAFVVIMVALVYAPKRFVYKGRGIKGHDVLLEAWQRFNAEHPDSRLVLVGGGFDEAGTEYRRELVARFRLAEDTSVTWLDSVDDVRPYYAAADLSVSPSLSDNHGAALEAGAMGVPSVVSDAGALPEAVDRDACWIVPKDDPHALVVALNEAYAEHRAGRLTERSDAVRDRIVRFFDSARAAAVVADVVENAADVPIARAPDGRLISLFTETRLSSETTAPDGFARYLDQGDRLCVVARTGDPDAGGGEELRPLPDYRGPAGLLRALPRLVPAIADAVTRAEVIVLQQPGAIGFLAAAVCKVLRRKYSVEVIGDAFDVLASGTFGPAGRVVANVAARLTGWVVGGASAVLYVTNFVLQRRYPATPGRFTIALSNVRMAEGTLLDKPRKWLPGPFCVIAVGTHEQLYKGHDVLLRALYRLVEARLDVHAVVVGGGRRHGELVALAEALGIADRVSFIGQVRDRRLMTVLLDSADLFAMPSRAEGLPRALIEAMARALPAVGTCVGGIPELLEPGCLVEADDDEALARVIDRLLTDPREWEQQSRRNLELARTYEKALLDERFSTWLSHIPAALSDRRTT